MLNSTRLRTLLSYDPATGTFARLVSLSNSVKVGDAAGTSLDNLGYTQLWVDGKHYRGHQMAWLHFYGEWPDHQIDHINGDRSDNRISNLRLATSSQNKTNARRRKDNTSGFKGVSYSPTERKWKAQITVNGKNRLLGRFASKFEAAEAYKVAAVKHFGAFARIE